MAETFSGEKLDIALKSVKEAAGILSGILDDMYKDSPDGRAARAMQKKAYARRAEDDDEEADRLEARAEELYAAADAA
jgi:hypothetical protein